MVVAPLPPPRGPVVLWLGCGAGLVLDGPRVGLGLVRGLRVGFRLIQLGIRGCRVSSTQVRIGSGFVCGWLRAGLLGLRNFPVLGGDTVV